MRQYGTRINGPTTARGSDERMTGSTVLEPGELLEVEYHFANWLSEIALQPLAWDMARTVENNHDVTVIWRQYGRVWLPDSNSEEGGRWQNVVRMQMKPNYPKDAGLAPIALIAVGAVLGSISTFLIARTGIGVLREWRKIAEITNTDQSLAASVAKWTMAAVVLWVGWQGIKTWKEG